MEMTREQRITRCHERLLRLGGKLALLGFLLEKLEVFEDGTLDLLALGNIMIDWANELNEATADLLGSQI